MSVSLLGSKLFLTHCCWLSLAPSGTLLSVWSCCRLCWPLSRDAVPGVPLLFPLASSRMFVFCPIYSSVVRIPNQTAVVACALETGVGYIPPSEFIRTGFDLLFLSFIFCLNRSSLFPLIVWPCSLRSHPFPPSRCPTLPKAHSLFPQPSSCCVHVLFSVLFTPLPMWAPLPPWLEGSLTPFHISAWRWCWGFVSLDLDFYPWLTAACPRVRTPSRLPRVTKTFSAVFTVPKDLKLCLTFPGAPPSHNVI